MSTYLHEFLFRGRAPGSAEPPAWHVILAQDVTPPGGVAQTILGGALTPEQAEAAGYALPEILAGLDTAVMADRDAKAAALGAMTAERDALAARIAEAGAVPSAPGVSTDLGPVVSDRQFFQALAMAGDITEAEALAAVMTGTMPARIEDAVRALPADQQFGARMLLSGATTFDRHHPMVALLGQILDRDDAALDALWAAAGKL